MQPKDYRKNDSTYIKYDRKGSIAGLVEVVISKLLDFVRVGGNPFSHVDYWLEQESLEVGCCSKDFCGQGLTQLSLFKLLNASTGLPYKDLSDTLNTLSRVAGNDARQHFLVVLALDYLLFNDDRHYNNYVLCVDTTGNIIHSPAFDFGEALFSASSSLRTHPIKELRQYYQDPKPFGREQYNSLSIFWQGPPVVLNYRDFRASVDWWELCAFYPERTVMSVHDLLNRVINSWENDSIIEVTL